MLVKPRPEILQNRFFLLETQLFPLFIITGILFVNGVFHGKQPIAVLDSLYCRLAVASYVISVRRIKSSLTASFRFYLTIDTLAVQLYTSLSPRRVRDFHPLERAHGAQTKSPVCTYLCKPGLYLTYLVTIKLYQFRNFISCFLHRFFKFSKADICLFGCYIYF